MFKCGARCLKKKYRQSCCCLWPNGNNKSASVCDVRNTQIKMNLNVSENVSLLRMKNINLSLMKGGTGTFVFKNDK